MKTNRVILDQGDVIKEGSYVIYNRDGVYIRAKVRKIYSYAIVLYAITKKDAP